MRDKINTKETDRMIADLRKDWLELKECNDAQSVDARRIIERELEMLGGMTALTTTGFAR